MDYLITYGRSIREFQNTTNMTVFAEAQQYPKFFDKHLVDPNRKIKAFIRDPNANIRTFYFQYLILCFEIDNQNSQLYVNKLQKIVWDPNFIFLFLEEDDDKLFNDKQFKRFMLEFLDILDSTEFQTVELAINRFPIIDVVFVYFFRSLLIYAQITDDFDSYIDRNILFGFFMQSFKIDVAIFQGKCLKFFEAEVFLYEETPEEIYMVFKDVDNQSVKESSFDSRQDQIYQNHKQVVIPNRMLDKHENQSSKNYGNLNKFQKYQKNYIGNNQQNLDNDSIFKKSKEIISNKMQIDAYNRQNHHGIIPKPNETNKKQAMYDRTFKKQYPLPQINNRKTRVQEKYLQKQYRYPAQQSINLKNNNYSENKYQTNLMNSECNREGRTTRATTINGYDHNLLVNQNMIQETKKYQNQEDMRKNLHTQNSYGYRGQDFTNSMNIYTLPIQNRVQRIISHNKQTTNQSGNNKANMEEVNIYSPYQNSANNRQNFQHPTVTKRQFDEQSKNSMKNNPLFDKIMEKLNVSKQFTDSLTLAKMGQPYQSHIKTIRNRSREFRQSLLVSFK